MPTIAIAATATGTMVETRSTGPSLLDLYRQEIRPAQVTKALTEIPTAENDPVRAVAAAGVAASAADIIARAAESLVAQAGDQDRMRMLVRGL